MANARLDDVKTFLLEFKFFAQHPDNFTLISRKKNLDSLALLGLTARQVRRSILQLTVKNYSEGPNVDRDRKDANIWVFGMKINDEEVYIKLSDNFSSNVAKCISFHKAEYAMNYPYMGGGE